MHSGMSGATPVLGKTPASFLILLVSAALASGLLAGCASTPPTPLEPPPVYPAPPDEARFIYERTLRINEDVEGKSRLARFKTMATGRSQEARGIKKPWGVAARQGKVYVTDTAQRAVLLFDIAAEHYRQFGEDQPGELIKPIDLTLASNGDVYVADVSARRVKVYDADGKHLRTLGEDGTLQRPTGVALSPDDSHLYVVDLGGVENQEHRVQVLDPQSGALLQTIGKRGEGLGEFNLPVTAATAPDGTLYVVDGGNFRVQAFGPDGQFRSSFGELGRFPGQFARPKGIATDPAGNIYVVDNAFGNVQIFNSQGQLLMFLGNRGNVSLPGRFSLPVGVAVDENGWIYIADGYFRKVEVFRPIAAAAPGTAPNLE